MLRPVGGVIFGETVMMSSIYLDRGNSTQRGGSREEREFHPSILLLLCKILMFAGRVGVRDRAKEVFFSLFCKRCCQRGRIDGDEKLCFLKTLLCFSAAME